MRFFDFASEIFHFRMREPIAIRRRFHADDEFHIYFHAAPLSDEAD